MGILIALFNFDSKVTVGVEQWSESAKELSSMTEHWAPKHAPSFSH